MKISNWHIVLGSLWCMQIWGQAPQLSAKLNRDTLRIGEQVVLTLQVQGKPKTKISFPTIGDTLSKTIEVINVSKVDSALNKEGASYTQKVTITAFDSGAYQIPALTFVVENKSTSDTLKTRPLMIHVQTLAIDTAKGYKDIKTVFEVPAPPTDYTWMWWLLLLIPIAAALYYFLKIRKPKPEAPKVVEVQIPAHEQALKDLMHLELEKLWQKNEYKSYHSRLTEIVRTYIEKRFKVHAMELTSDQVLSMMKQSKLVTLEQRETLAQLLHLADMVKFAKYVPIGSENELSMQNAQAFVQQTAITESKPSEA